LKLDKIGLQPLCMLWAIENPTTWTITHLLQLPYSFMR